MDLERLKAPFPAEAIEWRDVPGFPGYRVGSDGSVWSCRTTHGEVGHEWRRLSPDIGANGYRRVRLSNAGRVGRWLLHRLVLTLFSGPCPDGMEACHRDGDRGNNAASNLRWATHRENEHDKCRHGTAQVGENHSRLKLSEAAVREIRRRYVPHVVTCKVLAREYGVDPTMVHAIVRRKCWTHI